MTSQITDQLAATKLNDASSEANWKEGLIVPAKDARPQTEVSIGIGIGSGTCLGTPSRIGDDVKRIIGILPLSVCTFRLTYPI